MRETESKPSGKAKTAAEIHSDIKESAPRASKRGEQGKARDATTKRESGKAEIHG